MRARLVGLAALVGTIAFVVGFPIVLATLPGVPRPSWSDISEGLTQPDDGTIALQLLVVVAAIAYVSFVAAFIIEVVAAVRRTAIPRLPGLGWQRRGAAGVVAAIAVLFAGPIAAPSAAPSTSVAAAADTDQTLPQHDDHRPAHPRQVQQREPGPGHHHVATTTYITQPGDSLWSIAAKHLGPQPPDARIVKLVDEIADLNRGRVQADGGALDDSHWIQPGWTLAIPEQPAATGGGDVDAAVTVQPGDTLSELAARHLGDAEKWRQLYEANLDTIDDPDLIYPGQRLTLPTDRDTRGIDQPPAGHDRAPHTHPAEQDHSDAHPQTSDQAETHPPPRSLPSRGPAEAPPTSIAPATTHARETAESGEGDSVLRAPWVLAGLTGGGVLLAGALFIGLQQRRRAQFRARRPGRAIAPPDPELVPAEMTITAAGKPAAATVEFMDAALRRLAAGHEAGSLMPALAAVELGEDTLTLHLSGEPAVDLPPPWKATPDRMHWECSTAVNADELGPAPGNVESPYPLLVTIGTADDGTTWLLNCEELGTLTVTGDPEGARDLVRHLAAQAAVNPWSRAVRIDCVGVGEEAAPFDERIHYHAAGTPGSAATAEVLADAVKMVDRARRHDTDVTTGRTGLHDDDVWPSRLLLVDADTQEPDGLNDLLELVDSQVGRAATSVIVAGEREDTPGVVLEVTPAGRVQLELAELDLLAVGLSREETHGCALLYAHGATLADAEVPVDETATNGWASYADQTGGLRREHTLPRNISSVDEPTSSILDGADEDYIREAAAVPEDLEALAPKVPARVRTEVEDADPTLDADVADWFADDCDRPRLSLLGPITARTHGKALQKRKPYFTELLAYLALRRRHGATSDEACDAFGIEPAVARGYIRIVRDWLGTNPRTGDLHLPHADNAPAAKTRGVNVYQVDKGLLIDIDLFRRLRVRGEARGGADGQRDLVKALELVTGRPFDQQRPGGWSWLSSGERIDEYMTVAIADVAFTVTTDCLEKGDLPRARTATELAVLAAPYEESTRLCQVRVTEAEGNRDEADRILRDEVCNRSDDGDAPTELSERTETILRNHQWPA